MGWNDTKVFGRIYFFDFWASHLFPLLNDAIWDSLLFSIFFVCFHVTIYLQLKEQDSSSGSTKIMFFIGRMSRWKDFAISGCACRNWIPMEWEEGEDKEWKEANMTWNLVVIVLSHCSVSYLACWSCHVVSPSFQLRWIVCLPAITTILHSLFFRFLSFGRSCDVLWRGSGSHVVSCRVVHAAAARLRYSYTSWSNHAYILRPVGTRTWCTAPQTT